MAQFLYVFAASDAPVSPDKLTETVEQAWYGEGELRTETLGHESDLLAIALPGAGRPITVHVDADSGTVATMIDEQLDEHGGVPDEVADKLRSTRQVISIEVFPESLGDDGWELVDVLQSSLARELNGLVVTDDGIYDAGLTRIAP